MVTSIAADTYATGSGTAITTQLQYPAGIAAGDTLLLFGLTNGVTGTAKATGTGITVPAGYTEDTTTASSPHAYSSSMCVTVWKKTAAGTESGGIAVTWGGGSSASRTSWTIVAIPAAYTYRGIVWNDQATLTDANVGVPAFTHTGTDIWATLGFERGSTPSTAWSATPAGTTLLDSAFGTSSGACSAGVAVATAVDRDGSVGAGTWTTNTANSAGRVAATVVATYPRVTKTTGTTWDVAVAMSRVTKTSSAVTWDVRSRVTKTTATTWNVRARVAKTTATTWNVDSPLTRIVKTQATTWDVASPLTRITKTTATTWNVRARVAKTQATTWNTRTRVAKSTSTTWNLSSMLSQAAWPAFVAHRGGDPGPEETLFAYDATWAKSAAFWHEGDLQVLNDGTTMVANHDDDVDRMYASGPVATGNVSAISPTNWDLEFWRVNTGFTGTARQAMRLSAWTAKYGAAGTSGPAIGLWECKTGTDIADCVASLAGQQGQVVINCNSVADAQAAVAAGFQACYQTNAPNFATDFTPNGIKYLSINYTSMTGTIATNAIAAGVKVLMYTVNSTANRDSMLALFSDTSYAGFITNKPQTISGTTRVTKTTATTWNVRARVAKTTATTFDVKSRVAKTTATTWDTRGRVTKTTATTWNTRARLAKTTATTWNVRLRVPKTTATTWNTDGSLTRVSKATATTWNTRGRVPKTTSTTWNTRLRVPKTTAASWDTRARLVKATPTNWDVRARVGKTTATTWNIAARVAKLQSTTYGVRSRVFATRSTTWDVAFLVPVGDATAVDRPVVGITTAQHVLGLIIARSALELTGGTP